MVSGTLVYRFVLEAPLDNVPQVDRYTLLITELGTKIVALTLYYCFDCATIVVNSAIEPDKIYFSYAYIFLLFCAVFLPSLF